MSSCTRRTPFASVRRGAVTVARGGPVLWGGRAALLLALAATPLAQAGLPTAGEGGPLPSLAPMLEAVTPAVVNIATEGHIQIRNNPLLNDPFFRRFFNIPPEETFERKTQSLGSGVIVDAGRGLVVTNNHVIANADQISVKLRDGRVFEAELVGTDPETDLAVVKIAAKGLTAIKFADSDQVRVGDFVVAIGNPFGLGQTVTSGIISALARSGLGIGEYENYIQTDASINPGNSGGALVNLRGELVGINTAIFSQSGGNIGIGFAIPSNYVRRVTEQLVEFGEVRRGSLGVMLQDLNPELAQAFDLQVAEGAVVVQVSPNSAAEKAGLQAGDVVTAVNGKPTKSASEVRNQIGLMRVGEKVRLSILRNGKPQELLAELADKGEERGLSAVQNPRLSGVTVSDIPEDSPAFGRVEGVMVVEVERGSRAWRSGLRPGDIITSVNRKPVKDLDAFLKLVRGSDRLLVGIRRGNGAAFLVLK